MKILVKAKSEGGMKTVVRTAGFELITDEPENIGGGNEGANPVAYMLAGLAGCYTVVGKMVASEMGFEIRGLDMNIEGEMNPARFAGKSYEDRAGLKNITAVLTLDADVDGPTREKWIKAVEDRCPVTDNLTHPTPIDIKVK